LLDLLEGVLRAVDADRDARDAGPLGGGDREGLAVEGAAPEPCRDPTQAARTVLDDDGQRVLHSALASTVVSAPGYSSMSSAAAPAGIIGKTCSAGAPRQSTRVVRPSASASSSAVSSSPSSVTTMPTPP